MLEKYLELERDRAQTAAVKTLESMKYTYHGGELWKPPLAKPPFCIANDFVPENMKLAEILSKAIALELKKAGDIPLHDFKKADVIIRLNSEEPMVIAQFDLSIWKQ